MRFREYVGAEEGMVKLYLGELEEACRGQKVRLRRHPVTDGYFVPELTLNEGAGRSVFFSAGIHGDEVAGPWGVLEWLKAGPAIPDNLTVVVFPIVNPLGFERGVRTLDRRDMNRRFCDKKGLPKESALVYQAIRRQRGLQLVHTIHEDDSKGGFYVYFSNPRHEPMLTRMVKLAGRYFPIEDSRHIHEEPSENGLVPRDPTLNRKRDRKRCTLEEKVFQDGIDYITTETPGGKPLGDRVKCTKELIEFTLRHLV